MANRRHDLRLLAQELDLGLLDGVLLDHLDGVALPVGAVHAFEDFPEGALTELPHHCEQIAHLLLGGEFWLLGILLDARRLIIHLVL